ncbi:MAG: DUF4012 domain-containing protein [bacterium]|nr:DUF4012 domain-containing protein [bacterium]
MDQEKQIQPETKLTEIKKIEIEDVMDKKKLWQNRKAQIIGGFAFLLFLAIIIPGFMIFGQARVIAAHAQKLKEVTKSKDLKAINTEIAATKGSLEGLENSLRLLSWAGFIPFIGSYQQDAVHMVRAGEAGLNVGEIIVSSLTPYADMLGFSGGNEIQGGEKTAADRITFLVTTLDKISPDLDKVGEQARIAKAEVDKVDPNHYPKSIQGRQIREPLSQMVSLIDEIATLTTDAKPLIQNASWLLGNDAPRHYLLLLQNDGELRPTGGFITAYAILEVNKGQVKPLLSEDIYTADAAYKPTLTAPDALIKYVALPYAKNPRWMLRDMNISPDFKTSMETFSPEFQKATKLQYDGIVAVDTKMLSNLLNVLGPTGVGGWGNFSAEPDKRCNGCPQVVFELENLITKPLNRVVAERKAIIGPLMHSILANAFGSPKEKLPGLFEAVYTSATEKHILFYFPTEKDQAAVESFNLAGRIKDFPGDYFALNDSNFSGAKVNIFLKQEVEQKYEVASDGTITKNVIITYKNPSPASDCNLERGGLCLNAPYRDWVRLYVPQGSKLVDSSGLETDIKTYDDLGKTVFEGFYGDKYPLRPEGQAKISFKYQLPFKANKDLRLLIQKQPGTPEPLYTLDVKGHRQEFPLTIDKELRLGI